MARVQGTFPRISAVVALIGLTACSDSGGGVVVPGESAGAVADITVSPSSSTIQVGLTVQMTATPVDGAGNDVSGDVTWTSS